MTPAGESIYALQILRWRPDPESLVFYGPVSPSGLGHSLSNNLQQVVAGEREASSMTYSVEGLGSRLRGDIRGLFLLTSYFIPL